jgi:hypothetical protein
MVVTPAGQVSVQASYRMRSGQQRLELVLPKDVQFDTEPLWIDGRSVTLERGKEGQMFVPLVSRNPDEPFLLELRYTLPGDGSRLDLPQFPREPAVQKVYLSVYIPFDRVLLAKSGPWTDEFDEGPCGERGTACVVRHDEDSLRQWVLGGKQLPGETSAKGFHTDGKLYLFSTLEPKGPPDGSLGLVLLGEKWLDGLVLGLIVLLGVVLVPAAARTRLLAAGLLLVALAICGLFWPLAASQIAGPRLGNALLIVAVIWTVLYCGWSLPRICRGWTCCRKSPVEAAAPPADLSATTPPAEPAPSTPGDQAGAAPSSEGGPSHE